AVAAARSADRRPGRRARAQRRKEIVDPVAGAERDRVRNQPCRHDPDQSSGQPDRGKIRTSALRNARLLQQGEHFSHRDRAAGNRGGKQMESKLFRVRFFRTSAQTGRRRKRARFVFPYGARLGPDSEKTYGGPPPPLPPPPPPSY